jgi:NAD(P)-dependent dehydrogenase (short-subunit alcohol dehydrogenase family)
VARHEGSSVVVTGAASGITPVCRIAEPEEVAPACAFLAGPDAAMITGHILAVDGGWLANGSTMTS